MRKAMVVWVVGLVTAVPYATYHLLFVATRGQYAALITFVLFWIFGYWSLLGPLITVAKVRGILRAFERARSGDELATILTSPDARDAAIELIASENRVPRFVAALAYRKIASRVAADVESASQRGPT